MKTKIERIQRLVDDINAYNRAYYVDCKPVISDYEFDMLLKELESLENETGYVLSYSPTQRVGSDKQNDFNSVNRTVMMGSIENCYDVDELKDWLNKMKAYGTFLLEPKYDGTSCSIIYKNGVLSVASTRGNGYVGDDITENVKTIKNVPLKLSIGGDLVGDYRYDGIYIPDEIEIRGEILLPKSELKRINIERENEGLPVFANERNAAAGSIKQKDSRVTASRNLVFKPYGVICNDDAFACKYLKSQHNCLDVAHLFGFEHGWYARCIDAYTLLSILSEFEDRFLKTQDFCMDGAVIKIDDIENQRVIGCTQKTPKWAKAFKFKQEQVSTKLNSVTIQIGMSGQLGFVGEVDPVEVDGSVISRVTLNNMDYIREMDLKLNSYVFIKKNGAVIPGVVGVDYERNVLEGVETKEILEPTVCPYCGCSLSRINEDGAHLYCTNLNCKERVIQKLTYFVRKDCMNIDGLSEKTIRKMYDVVGLRCWNDLYVIAQCDVLEDSGEFGPKTIANFKSNIESSKRVSADRVLCSLGIPMIGKVTSQKIMEHFESFYNLMNASESDISSVEGVGEVAASKLYSYIRTHINEFINATNILTTRIEKKTVTDTSNLPLNGMTILATGTLVNFQRDEIKQSVIDNGGKYASGVSGKLTFMIVGSDAGKSKLDKATSLGVKMITEDEYIKMIS